jgi:hypothetical protein
LLRARIAAVKPDQSTSGCGKFSTEPPKLQTKHHNTLHNNI